mgnify:CR=1 FL=1|jgi:hypothetical protein|nr:MAG TPA_asm: hypothetical protein [Caudoviricetes sp.]
MDNDKERLIKENFKLSNKILGNHKIILEVDKDFVRLDVKSKKNSDKSLEVGIIELMVSIALALENNKFNDDVLDIIDSTATLIKEIAKCQRKSK